MYIINLKTVENMFSVEMAKSVFTVKSFAHSLKTKECLCVGSENPSRD